MTARRLVLPLLAISLAAPLAAQAPSPTAKEPRTCSQSEQVTGSRIRVPPRCRTAEQWRQDDERKARIPVSLRVTEGQNSGSTKPAN